MARPPVVLLGAALVTSACGSRPAPAPRAAPVEPVLLEAPRQAPAGELALAAIFPVVGRYALSGLQSLDGARLAVADLNAAGGIAGRRLALLEYRTGSYFIDARAAAALAARAGVLAIVGSNSSDLSMAVAQEAEINGVVQVSNVSTAQDLTWDPVSGRDREFVFRVCSSDVVMGALIARFARERLGARRAAVLYEVGRTYSAKLARAFVEGFGGPAATVAQFFYLSLETDFRGPLARVAAFRPDVVFLPGSFTDASLVAIQARDAGLDATLLGADSWSSPLLFKRGGPGRRAYFADHCAPPAAFVERFRAATGAAPHGCRAALAYDAVQALAAALAELGPLGDAALGDELRTTRHRLRDALAGVAVAGIAGGVRFDAHGDGRHRVAILAVEPGETGASARVFAWLGEP